MTFAQRRGKHDRLEYLTEPTFDVIVRLGDDELHRLAGASLNTFSAGELAPGKRTALFRGQTHAKIDMRPVVEFIGRVVGTPDLGELTQFDGSHIAEINQSLSRRAGNTSRVSLTNGQHTVELLFNRASTGLLPAIVHSDGEVSLPGFATWEVPLTPTPYDHGRLRGACRTFNVRIAGTGISPTDANNRARSMKLDGQFSRSTNGCPAYAPGWSDVSGRGHYDLQFKNASPRVQAEINKALEEMRNHTPTARHAGGSRTQETNRRGIT
jgi:hypothetical protein